uniref:DEAD/DEAH box helicase n=1 Tax=uncultured Bifidobacterium sp. TaxID=165187 RepID=UPI002607C0B2
MSDSSDSSSPAIGGTASLPVNGGAGVSPISLDTRVSSVISNKRRVSALRSLGIVTAGDALTYYPFRVEDPAPIRTLASVLPGRDAAVVVRVVDSRVVPLSSRQGWRLEATVVDSSDDDGPSVDVSAILGGPTATVVFFSRKRPYIAWMERRLQKGATVVVRGTAGEFNGALQFVHPDLDVVADDAAKDEVVRRMARPRPVYHANSRISSDHVHEAILDLLSRLGPDSVPDRIPESIRDRRGFPRRREAVGMVHDPESVPEFRRAIEALRYEEALVSQVAVLRQRSQTRADRTFTCADRTMVDEYLEALPFSLTDGQRDVMAAIAEDMASGHPMHRLLQGEVGSGKTVVAMAAMLQAVGSGHQAVLVAPTQVLAGQHHRSLE